MGPMTFMSLCDTNVLRQQTVRPVLAYGRHRLVLEKAP